MQSRRKCSAENDVSHSEFKNVYRDCLRRKEKICLRNAVYEVCGKKYVLFTSAGKKLLQFQVIASVFLFSSSSRCNFPAVALNESALYRQSAFTSWFFATRIFPQSFLQSLCHLCLSFTPPVSPSCVLCFWSLSSPLCLSLSLPLSPSLSLTLSPPPPPLSLYLSPRLSLSSWFYLSLTLNFAFLDSDATSFVSLVLCSLK